jgi:hypothetical protein
MIGLAVVVVVAVFFVLLVRGTAWLYGAGLSKLTPEQRVTALDQYRGRIIQIGTVVFAIVAVVFTGLNYLLSREGHVTDRYTKAIEQLGSDRLDVRLGAIYALERIMIDSPRDHPTIVEVLAAYVREHARLTKRAERRAKHEADGLPGIPFPDTDVQAALTVLGRRPSGREERGSLNLQATDLTGADLVPLEYSIGWLTCVFASIHGVVVVSLPGAAQDRLLVYVPGTRPGRPGVPQRPGERC